jgi:calcineurin-like phosphoesterase family protein
MKAIRTLSGGEYQGLSMTIGPDTHNQQALWGCEKMNKHNGGNVYIWSDLHLGHGNVIRYCDRPFAGVTEMNTALLHAWKATVKYGDTIINLGDVSLKLGKEYLATVIHRLPGYKILIMGNHDWKKPVRWWMDVGFNEVYPHPVVYEGKYILSHAVVDIFKGSGFINFHGHIHNLESGISNCINVSVEKTGYKPVLLEGLASEFEEMNRVQRGENDAKTVMRRKQ